MCAVCAIYSRVWRGGCAWGRRGTPGLWRVGASARARTCPSPGTGLCVAANEPTCMSCLSVQQHGVRHGVQVVRRPGDREWTPHESTMVRTYSSQAGGGGRRGRERDRELTRSKQRRAPKERKMLSPWTTTHESLTTIAPDNHPASHLRNSYLHPCDAHADRPFFPFAGAAFFLPASRSL